MVSLVSLVHSLLPGKINRSHTSFKKGEIINHVIFLGVGKYDKYIITHYKHGIL